MKIYIGHSTKYDYKNLLYEPLLKSNLAEKHEFILPHASEATFNSKEIIEQADLFIAEISEPSLGLGIEIGRAEMINKKILCICNNENKISSSIKYVDVDIIIYSSIKDMISKIEEYLSNNF